MQLHDQPKNLISGFTDQFVGQIFQGSTNQILVGFNWQTIICVHTRTCKEQSHALHVCCSCVQYSPNQLSTVVVCDHVLCSVTCVVVRCTRLLVQIDSIGTLAKILSIWGSNSASSLWNIILNYRFRNIGVVRWWSVFMSAVQFCGQLPCFL